MAESINRLPFYVSVKGVVRDQKTGEFLLLKEVQDDRWENPGGRVDAPTSAVTPNQTPGQLDLRGVLEDELSEELPDTRIINVGEHVLHVAIGDRLVEDGLPLLIVYYGVLAAVPENVQYSDEHSDLILVDEHGFRELDVFASDAGAIERSLMVKPYA